MNVAFLIGNGFDLKIGMKTGYCHFYDYYLQQSSSNPIIQSFKKILGEELEKDTCLWSDLEEAIGVLTNKYNSIEDFDIILDDIREKLAEHITNEENRYDFNDVNAKKLFEDIAKCQDFLQVRADRENLSKYKNTWGNGDRNVNIISFNYTQSLEKLLGYNGTAIRLTNSYVLKDIKHIHGVVDLNMILGVNDISQISNEVFRTNSYILNALVKPEANRSAGHLLDYDCQRIIQNSKLICLFGLSFGKTDQIWWEMIGKRLLSNDCMVVIFAHFKQKISQRDIHKKVAALNTIKSDFLFKTGLTTEEQENVRDKIIVGYSTDIFNIQVKEKKKSN